MAITFHPEGRSSSSICSVRRRRNDGLVYVDMHGYVIALPSARNYCDVVEHLLIMQECFAKGFSISDNIE